MIHHQEDPTEFYCSYEDSSFKVVRMPGGEETGPWAQVCITGDDQLDLNLNLSLRNARRLFDELHKFIKDKRNLPW